MEGAQENKKLLKNSESEIFWNKLENKERSKKQGQIIPRTLEREA